MCQAWALGHQFRDNPQQSILVEDQVVNVRAAAFNPALTSSILHNEHKSAARDNCGI